MSVSEDSSLDVTYTDCCKASSCENKSSENSIRQDDNYNSVNGLLTSELKLIKGLCLI